jgi:hypothetical protein
MLTALECMAKAEELDALAGACPEGAVRHSYYQTADGWRRAAILARQQEVWDASQPGD